MAFGRMVKNRRLVTATPTNRALPAISAAALPRRGQIRRGGTALVAARLGSRRVSLGPESSATAGGGRWPAKRKVSVVLDLLRGADLESTSRKHRVTLATLSAWRDRFLAAGEASLKSREVDLGPGAFSAAGLRLRHDHERRFPSRDPVPGHGTLPGFRAAARGQRMH